MSRQDANAAFAHTSFLYGSNAPYIEDLHARYEADPKSVDAEWQAFFASLKDNAADVTRGAQGASWKRPNWPAPERGELVSALDGDWHEAEKALGDKLTAKAQTSGIELASGLLVEGEFELHDVVVVEVGHRDADQGQALQLDQRCRLDHQCAHRVEDCLGVRGGPGQADRAGGPRVVVEA